MNSVKLSSGKVEFCLGIEEIHMSTPPDLSQEQFRVFSSVEKSKLPYSQLGLVISSYHQTIGKVNSLCTPVQSALCRSVEIHLALTGRKLMKELRHGMYSSGLWK